MTSSSVGCVGARLLLEGVLGDVDMDRTRATAPGDVERLGDDPRQVVGIADEVVVLGHRQGDAVDVDLLEGVLADERCRDVAGDRDHRDGVQQRRADPGDEVRGARPGRAHAHPDPAGHPRVPVGGVGAALLVADEDVAQLRVVAEDVVQRQDHAARVAEEDVDALAQKGLAQDVGADARPLELAALMEHALPGALDRRRLRRAVVGHVAASGSLGRAAWRSSSGMVALRQSSENERPSPSRRGSLRSIGGRRASGARPSVSLGSPPGAGNEPKKATKPRKGEKKVEEGYVGRTESIGTCTRRPSDVTTTATLRRSPDPNQANGVSCERVDSDTCDVAAV